MAITVTLQEDITIKLNKNLPYGHEVNVRIGSLRAMMKGNIEGGTDIRTLTHAGHATVEYGDSDELLQMEPLEWEEE